MQPATASGARTKAERKHVPILEVVLALSTLMALATFAPMASAAPAPPTAGPIPHTTAATSCNGNATCDLDSTLTNIQYFLIGVGVLLAGIAFAVYGIQHLTGAMEEMPPEKKFQRKKQFVEIAVGLIIVMLSVVLVTVAKGLIVTS